MPFKIFSFHFISDWIEWWIPGHTIERENECERKSLLCILQSSLFHCHSQMWYQSVAVFMQHKNSFLQHDVSPVNEKKGKREDEKNPKSSKWMHVLTNICLLNFARFSVPFLVPFYKMSTWDCVLPFFMGRI